jgi:RNA polymerase sigma-70 factor (ECF subfamily)
MRRTAPSHSEIRIAAGLRRRDPNAVRALYEEYGPGALALLRDTIGDRMAVEDVYQQVLLEAWQRCPSYDPARASLRTWLSTIARSRAIDHLRRRVPEPCDPSRDPGRTTQRELAVEVLERMALEELLGRLPREEAEVVRLRFHCGLTQRQVGTALAIPLGTVKSRNASALAHLRAMLDEQEHAAA